MKYEITYVSNAGVLCEFCTRLTNDYTRFVHSVQELKNNITSIKVDKLKIYEKNE